MRAFKDWARLAYRLVVVWGVDIISLLATAAILPGFRIDPADGRSLWVVAVAAALLLGLVNLLVRPVVLLLALPFGFVAVSLVGLFVNAITLRIAAALLPGFVIDNWLAALVGGLVVALANTVLTGILTVDDEGSFYEGLILRLSKRRPFSTKDPPGRGLVMLEIDGLSYWHVRKAVEEGVMPTLAEMLREGGHVLSRVDCGLPSQTSSCQAGILFGDNDDIPAFRWYDKDRGKLMVSSHDAPEINARYAHGRGLLRGGSSINNMMNGDAQKSLLTLADLRSGDPEERQQRAQDLYLLMLDPYFFTRTLVLFLGDALIEVWQGLMQRVRNEQPRLNRLHHAYPLLRAATTVLMRDLATYLATLDIVRGTPALYVTLPGYDEVAHHSGTWSSDAFGTLRRYDRVIARIRDVIARHAPRPYDLLILSDHGQSFGATFKQRYGYDLKEYIEAHLPHGTSVVHTAGGDDGTLSVAAMAAELENVQQQGVGTHAGRAVVGRAQRFLQRGAEQRAPLPADPSAQVTVCGSGNLAQVYFDLAPRKVTLDELNAAYPGLVDALVEHSGVGFVVAYGADGTPIAFGAGGARDLHSSQVSGRDPLQPYGDVELRAAQVRRVADFDHAGDLIVMSTLYADGTVAALEELIGSHGGLGGEQTDAFLVHPADMHVPDTTNSADLFALLDARRGLPASEPKETPSAPEKETGDWSLTTLWEGLQEVRRWAGHALHALFLSPHTYRDVAGDPYMTGPALLIAVLAPLLVAGVAGGSGVEIAIGWLLRVAMWPLGVTLVFGAGRLLGGRGSWTATLRSMGFAQSVHVLELLAFIPALSPLVKVFASLLAFVATWMASVQAHELRGWRGFLLPLAELLVVVISIIALGDLIAGTEFAIEALLREVGLLHSAS